jgi:D-alanyl-D-alanine carboxypeptidase/D-alanyl-D-alanine-endopeptidase (penicillin-binding protein 4)
MRYFILSTLALAALPAWALDQAEFSEKMRKHLDALSAKTTAAVRMEVLGSSKEVFRFNDDRKMIPASDAKLLTSLAALEKLGPGFSFETKVLKQGKDLVLRGRGDPYLVSERLWLLAREVARTGIKAVGTILVDNSAFETYRGLMEFQGSGEPFTALVTPTGLNFNSVEIHVLPGKGPHPSLEAGPVPHSYATLKNEVIQTKGSGKNITVRPAGAENGHETFLVTGSWGKEAGPGTVYAAASQPEAYIAAVFAALLRKEGITVAKDFGGLVPGGNRGEELASIPSLPLQDLVRLYNTYSNNFMAEEVFQALAPLMASDSPVSFAKIRAAANDYLRRFPACSESELLNGSGLSWDTRVSAHCFTEAMQVAYRDFHIFADLLGSLPAGGETGTLKNRFKRAGSGFEPGKVRGKTGTLWSGEKILFSLIENDTRNDPGLLRELKDWEDKCVELLQQLRL